VIVRLSDFKSNEYKKLIGGSRYEPDEENPMLGFRGAARYIADDFAGAFEWNASHEARAQRHGPDQRRDHGAVRAYLGQAEKVVGLLGKNGLKRGENGLRDHDVRSAVQRDPGRAFLSTSTASRSVPTT
jgi:pyruvate,water dikinase